MAVGLHAVNLANKWLNMLSGTAFTAPTNTYAQLHTADPGAAGTTAVSAVTTRQLLTWSAAASGSKAIASASAFSMTATETITHISVWDATSAGNFMFSVALTTSKAVTSGDTLNLSALSIALTPIAA